MTTATENHVVPLNADPERPALLSPWAPYKYGCLVGRVFNHPRLSDGKVIVTSTVVAMNEDLGFAQTRNTYYILRDRRTASVILRLRRSMRR
jgi:hypothetical protein